jgi:hypothetical protein
MQLARKVFGFRGLEAEDEIIKKNQGMLALSL